MFSPTVRQGNSRGCWKTTPAWRPGSGVPPCTVTSPDVACSKPAISLSSVLFPLPEGPTSTRNSPAGTSSDSGPSAVTASAPRP